MVESVDFAVRDSSGSVARGMVAGEGASDFIQVGAGDEISLNLRKTNILKYVREGNDLEVVLVDGRTITLSGYYDAHARLYISSDGELTAVTLEDGGDGVIYADYGAVEAVGKWSPNDQLAFLGGDDLLSPAGEDDTTGMAMFAPAMLGGLGSAGVAAGAGLVGVGLLGGGGGNGGTSPTDPTTPTDPTAPVDPTDPTDPTTPTDPVAPVLPTVDNPDAESLLNSNTVDPAAVVSGTGEPGSTVVVILGDQTLETTIGEDGTWEVSFSGDSFPADGDLTSSVLVTAPDGTLHELDGPDFLIDMTPPPVAVTEGAQSTGDVENLAEYQDGITIRGTGEAGASVVVTVAGQSQETVVAADGSWNVTFSTDQLPRGEYSEAMTVSSTDIHGNTTTITDALVVDTEASVAFLNGAVTADNVVNAAEDAAGFTLRGTAEPGSSVVVTLGGAQVAATVAADGSWSADLSGTGLTTGAHTAIATATDLAGNVATASYVVNVDTEVSNFSHTTPTPNTVVADGIVNAAEGANGLVVSGTVEVGSSVSVQLASGAVIAATVLSDGTWSATIPAAQLPASEANDVRLTVRATDAYGNTTTQTSTVDFDPVVRNFMPASTVSGDNMVNAQEAADGFAISGMVEPGSAVVVTLANGAQQLVTAGADGQWSVMFHGSDLPGGTGTMAYHIAATDPVGNTASANGSFAFDLVAPESPDIIAFTRDAGALLGLRTDLGEAVYDIAAIDGAGQVDSVANYASVNSFAGYGSYDFADPVPNGSYLVVTDHDGAGNETSTLLVVDNTSAVTVDLNRAGLGEFDFGTIDLTFAPEANLTITEAQINALTGPDHTLVIQGDAADHVTALGAQDTGENTQIGGHTYSIYTLGDNSHLIIDDQITNLTL